MMSRKIKKQKQNKMDSFGTELIIPRKFTFDKLEMRSTRSCKAENACNMGFCDSESSSDNCSLVLVSLLLIVLNHTSLF